MSACILGFQEIDKTKLAMVGGKGANLGETGPVILFWEKCGVSRHQMGINKKNKVTLPS